MFVNAHKSQINDRPATRKNKTRIFGKDITYQHANSFRNHQNRSRQLSKDANNIRNQKNRSHIEVYHDEELTILKSLGTLRTRASSFLEQNTFVDPLNQYVDEISKYIVEQSFLSTISEDYMNWQTSITSSMRDELVKNLMFIHSVLTLSQDTLFLSVYLLDKYCYLKNISIEKYHLLGITCLFIASKYLQIKTPKLYKYTYHCEIALSCQQMIEMQADILITVQFKINQIVLPREIMKNRIQTLFKYKSEEEKINISNLSQYLLELTLAEYACCRMNANYLSAVIIYISSKLTQFSETNSEKFKTISFRKITENYQLSQTKFKQYFVIVMGLYKNRNSQKFSQINRKYRNIKQQ